MAEVLLDWNPRAFRCVPRSVAVLAILRLLRPIHVTHAIHVLRILIPHFAGLFSRHAHRKIKTCI